MAIRPNRLKRNGCKTSLQRQTRHGTSSFCIIHRIAQASRQQCNPAMAFAEWGADIVIGGHDHDYERLHRDGIVYIVNGLGGREIWRISVGK